MFLSPFTRSALNREESCFFQIDMTVNFLDCVPHVEHGMTVANIIFLLKIDFVVESHPAYTSVKLKADKR